MAKDKNFEQKFKAQLAPENEDVTRLACELLFVYFLYPTSVRRPRKTGLIHDVASWKAVRSTRGPRALIASTTVSGIRALLTIPAGRTNSHTLHALQSP